MTKPIIALDIDDVLADYADGFVRFSNERWGTNLTVDDYDEHWAEVWKVDIEEIRRRADEIHDARIVTDLTHKHEAVPVLEMLAKTHQIIVITSRRIVAKEDTLAWLKQYFPMINSEVVNFAGFWDTISHDSIRKTKADLAVKKGATVLIDDQLKHCLAAAEKGIEAILFGDYTWNQIDVLPRGVTRCKNWSKVEEYFATRQ